MAATDRDRVSVAGDATPCTDVDSPPDSPHIRLQLSSTADRPEDDWSTWMQVVALLRQHKFVPRIESVDGSSIVIDL